MKPNEHARAWLIAAKLIRDDADYLEKKGCIPAAEQMQLLANAALYVSSGYEEVSKESPE